jgi:hypothetical protein
MKLLCCGICNQVFDLSNVYKECLGGHGGGQYVDRLNAKVWGPKDRIFVLGFANNSFIDALRDQIKQGDSYELMPYAGKMTPTGRRFTAFIIPDSADSIIRVAERFDPIAISKDIYE